MSSEVDWGPSALERRTNRGAGPHRNQSPTTKAARAVGRSSITSGSERQPGGQADGEARAWTEEYVRGERSANMPRDRLLARNSDGQVIERGRLEPAVPRMHQDRAIGARLSHF